MQSSYTYKCSTIRLAILDVCPCVLQGTNSRLIPRINTPMHFRGQGIASNLLKACIRDADDESITLYIDVSASDGLTNKQLTAWYTRYGFKKHKSGYLERKPQRQ